MSETIPSRKEKETILIADDSVLNREILIEILGDSYDYIIAEDGVRAVETLSLGTPVDILLLDINMPKMDGFEVLTVMKERHWLDECPVIVISADNDAEKISRAYELGASDYILRPFSAPAIVHRVKNMLDLYAKQKKLVRLVEDQVFEREKTNRQMIHLFSHAIESRNLESGCHTLHVRYITDLLLHRLVQITDRYPLTEEDISLIASLSALHDIGKIAVPEEILNKPGKLTPAEWEIMKAHTTAGDRILDSVSPGAQSEKLMKIAHEIVRSHHERWDGKGYPDGLAGDEIPLAAQVVSLADVYDALTSDRCYKKALPHDAAILMIMNGECGAFNPLLLQCLKDVAETLRSGIPEITGCEIDRAKILHIADEMLSKESLPTEERTYSLAECERAKKEFFAAECEGIRFEYDVKLQKVTYVDTYGGERTLPRQIYLQQGGNLALLTAEDRQRIIAASRATTKKQPSVEMNLLIPVHRTYRWHRLRMTTLWSAEGDERLFILGHFADIHDRVVGEGVGRITADGKLAPEVFDTMKKLFGQVRMVDVSTREILEIDQSGNLAGTGALCAALPHVAEKGERNTDGGTHPAVGWVCSPEVVNGKIFSVFSHNITFGERDCFLQIFLPTEESESGSLRDAVPGKPGYLLMNFYRDTLTKAYSRAYLEDFLPDLRQSEGVMLVDVRGLHDINEKYGYSVGDLVLRDVAAVISSCLKEGDVMIRYGGDEFLLLLDEIRPADFAALHGAVTDAVSKMTVEGYPDLHPSVYIGGAYHVTPLAKAIAEADRNRRKEKESDKA